MWHGFFKPTCMFSRFLSFPSLPLHVVGKSPQSEWSALSLFESWKVFCEAIQYFQEKNKIQTQAFVMMSNHYHWLCCYDNFNKDPQIFNRFQHRVSREFLKLTNKKEEHSFFADSAKVTVIDNSVTYKNTYYYIYRNPLAAGLVSCSEDYPYSTLGMVLGRHKMRLNCWDQMNLIYNPQIILSAINQPARRE